jgi:CarboxypepD_reg-like domain
MSKSFKLKVAEPCHEDWQNMSPNAKGRHCQSCAKTVVDFSIMTDAEIVSFFKNKPQNVCGRFTTQQIEKSYPIVTHSQSMSYARAAALAAGLFVAATGCQELQSPFPKENMEQVDNTKLRLPNNFKAIFGTVKNEDKQPLIGAEIRSDENQLKVYSDMNGEFVILFDKNLQSIKLQCFAVGFDSKIIDIDLNSYNTDSDLPFILTSDKIGMQNSKNDKNICDKGASKNNIDSMVMVLGDIDYETIEKEKIASTENYRIPIDFKLLTILNRQKLVDNLLKQMKSKPQ